MEQAETIRDKAIISLFADSGLRLSALANINLHSIDWQYKLIKAKCKGGKEGLGPFGQRAEELLKEWLSQYPTEDKLWDIVEWGIC
ncbi:tyrosine-type recombinase/integrase [Chloroflexota bacterium]